MNALNQYKQMEKACIARGVSMQQVFKEAGFSHSLPYQWKHYAKINPAYNGKRRKKTTAKVWNAIGKHKVKYVDVKAMPKQLALPLSKTNGHDKTKAVAPSNTLAVATIPVRNKAQATLMNLIGERLSAMSVVQLALFYAKIVGEEG